MLPVIDKLQFNGGSLFNEIICGFLYKIHVSFTKNIVSLSIKKIQTR